jgi:hypothetical protein
VYCTVIKSYDVPGQAQVGGENHPVALVARIEAVGQRDTIVLEGGRRTRVMVSLHLCAPAV